MSQRLFSRFSKEILAGKKLFVPYITAGDRGCDFTYQAALRLAELGADAIELGVPFSDPIADGPAIQASSQRALNFNTTLVDIFKISEKIRKKSSIPILLMGYFNPFLQYSLKKSVFSAKETGVDGFIIPDFPPEESLEWNQLCEKNDISTVFLTTPNSTEKRLKIVAEASSGYIYYVSVTGITGARKALPKDLTQGIARIRLITPLPVLVGFGISTPQQAGAVAELADGVIVGSALVKTIEKQGSNQEALKRLTLLAQSMIKSIKNK